MNNIIQLIDSHTKENVNYEETTTWHDGTAMDDSKVDNVIYRKKSEKYYKRITDGYINVKWFGGKGDGTDEDYNSLLHAFTCAVKYKLNLYHPAGTYTVRNNNFPYKTLTPNSEDLFSCENITIYGDGNSTILRTISETGADVLNLHKVKDLHLKDFAVTAIVNNETVGAGMIGAGTNGISIIAGFDNITLDNIHIYDLYGREKSAYPTSVNKGNWNASTNTPTLINGVGTEEEFYTVSVAGDQNFGDFKAGDTIVYFNGEWRKTDFYIDGGKALTIQPGNTENVIGTLKATNIYAKNCAYGFGIDYFVDVFLKNKSSIDVDIISERCSKAISLSGGFGEASENLENKKSNIKIKCLAIDCQRDLVAERVFGCNIDLNVQTTLSAEDRRKLPNGSRYWIQSEKEVYVCSLLNVQNSNISIVGEKRDCDYKYILGAIPNYGGYGLTADTKLNNLLFNTQGIPSISSIKVVDVGGDYIRNNIIYFFDENIADLSFHVFISNYKNFIVTKDGIFNSSIFTNKINFLADNTEASNSYSYIRSSLTNLVVGQKYGSLGNLKIIEAENSNEVSVWSVRNDGLMQLSTGVLFGSGEDSAIYLSAIRGSFYIQKLGIGVKPKMWFKLTDNNGVADTNGWKDLTVEIEACADTASNVSSSYSQAEVQAILNELRDLKTKMRNSGILKV